MKIQIIPKTKMADKPKRVYKCSVCQEPGHNKAKCPTLKAEKAAPKAVEEKPQMLPTIYEIRVKEDNGDSISEYHKSYASIDGLVKGVEKIINQIKDYAKELEDEDEEEEEDEEDEEEREYETQKLKPYRDHCFYFTKHPICKNIPIPTKDYIQEFLNNDRIWFMNGLMIKVGELPGMGPFACEIYVTKGDLNP